MDKRIDPLDRRLIALLSEDGQTPAGDLALRLGVTAPTIRTRLRNLLKAGVLKIVGLVDPERVDGLTLAMVGLTVQTHSRMKELMERISALDKVNWAAIVTGRYDILVEIVLSNGMDDLYRFIDEDLPRVGGVVASESFVVMKSRRKWICLPEGAREGLE